MKRKVILLMTIGLMLILTGCNSTKEEKKDTSQTVGFYEVMSYLDKEDNWIYTFTLSYDKEKNITYRQFNGFNMKYDTMDGFYIPILDEKTEKEVGQLPPSIINLVNDQIHDEEFDKINDFFNEKKFVNYITIDDLKSLKTSYFSKEDLVILYNRVLDLEPAESLGKYNYSINFLKSKEEKDRRWQIVTLGTFGYLDKVRIDLKYKNGKYLSDLAQSGEASNEQQNTYKILEAIQTELLKNKEIDFDGLTKDMNQTEKTELQAVLSELN